MQNANRAPYQVYQFAIHVAQDEEGKNQFVQEMRCRKRNIGTHSMGMLGAGNGKDADLGLYQDESGTNKRVEAERDYGRQQEVGTTEQPPMNLKDRYGAMGQLA